MKTFKQYLTEKPQEDTDLIKISRMIYSYILDNYSNIKKEFDELKKNSSYYEIILGDIRYLLYSISKKYSMNKLDVYDLFDNLPKDFDKIQITLTFLEPNVIGEWNQYEKEINLNLRFFFPKFLNNEIYSKIVHELRHALDSFLIGDHRKTAKKYYNSKINGDHFDQYLSIPSEVNARYIEAVQYIIDTNIDINKKYTTNELYKIIHNAFRHYYINRTFPQGTKSKSYKRLVVRALKHIQHYINQ